MFRSLSSKENVSILSSCVMESIRLKSLSKLVLLLCSSCSFVVGRAIISYFIGLALVIYVSVSFFGKERFLVTIKDSSASDYGKVTYYSQ
ncbi:hypothetical protein JCM10003_2047 [Bacteroides pyogenes JCM 10003]|nr:hypothetical protein JCM10003_2047 [Bacteroides pyogenes JCM 10003]